MEFRPVQEFLLHLSLSVAGGKLPSPGPRDKIDQEFQPAEE
jgi:hypothetical protein